MMKAAGSSEIKKALKEKTTAELIELCLRLARFKKENKELLTYLLFEAEDLPAYLQLVKDEMSEGMDPIRSGNVFLAKKTIRKVLRIANKHIRYTGEKVAEVELLLHFLQLLRDTGIRIRRYTVLENIYRAQAKKVAAALEGLHEDLQHDYATAFEELSEPPK